MISFSLFFYRKGTKDYMIFWYQIHNEISRTKYVLNVTILFCKYEKLQLTLR